MASHKNPERLVIHVEKPNEKFLFHCGEQFLWESLPVGTRVIYPLLPLAPIENINQAIEDALENPLDADPLSTQLQPGMKVTIAFDDLSMPLPPMPTQRDPRKLIIEKVLEKCAEMSYRHPPHCGNRFAPSHDAPEDSRAGGNRVFSEFFPNRLYNHDAEYPDGNIMLGTTDHGEEVWIPKYRYKILVKGMDEYLLKKMDKILKIYHEI